MPVSDKLHDLMACVQEPSESVDAYATRMRQKSKTLTEWDATEQTKELKNKTVTASFVKGLKPNIRQFVLPTNPFDFENAISLARSYELNALLLPEASVPSLSASTAAQQQTLDTSMLDIQKRVASLELSAALNSSRGRGGSSNRRGRGRGRQPFRQNFSDPTRSRQNHSWSGPSVRSDSWRHQFVSHCDYQQAPSSHSSCRASHHCCCDLSSCRRSNSQHAYDERRRSPDHQRSSSRRSSRSPNRSYNPNRRRSHSPSASPSRSRYQSPNGYRSRH